MTDDFDIDWSVPGFGDNRAPVDLAEALDPDAIAAYLKERFEKHRHRAEDLLAADERFVAATADGIHDDDAAARATDHARQLFAASKSTEACREEIKAPVLAAGRQIDAAAKAITEPLNAAYLAVKAKSAPYLKRREDEARTAAACGTPSDLSRIHTVTGGVASLREEWKYRVVNITELLRAVLNGTTNFAYVKADDVQLAALAKREKGNASVPGVVFYRDDSVTIR